MKKDYSTNSRNTPDAAVALPLFGLLLLMPPLISLFATGLEIGGVPLIVLYVFGVWIALIVCTALLARHLDPGRSEEVGYPEPEPDPVPHYR